MAGIWEWVQDNADQLGVVLNAGLLATAIVTAGYAISTLNQTKRDSRDRTRPYVYADVVPSLAGMTSWDLIITNTGQSVARDLTLEIDHWPDPMNRFAQSIHTMAGTPRDVPPGARLRAYWRLGKEGMPEEALITMKYSSDDPKAPPYTDTARVRIKNSGLVPVGRQGPNPPADMDSDRKAFYRMLQVLSEGIRELSR